MRQLTLQDRPMTSREIETTFSGTNIHSILYEHLTVKKICSRWIPHKMSIAQKKARIDWSKEMFQKYVPGASKHVYDIVTGDESWIYAYEPESKQQSNVRVFLDEPNPTKIDLTQSTSKQMIACFFGKTGHVAIVLQEERRTVNSEWYTTICLPVVFQEIGKTNRRRRITLHHDNASSNTSAQTRAFLSTQNIDLMSHLSYNPDLAPNDFVFIPVCKKIK